MAENEFQKSPSNSGFQASGSGNRNQRAASRFFLLCLFILFFIAACGGEKEIVISGQTMGTTYQVKAYPERPASADLLKKKIAARLEELNRVFSTYRPDSEISRFNRLDRAGEPFAVSADFIRVMKVARKIFRLTGGAWDGTVDPLVRLWGFHDKYKQLPFPTSEEIQKARQAVGFDFIGLASGNRLVKYRANVTLDLASIAKGYAVDQVAALLDQEGIERHLVDIGGEVVATGRKPDGSPWKVGINRPDPDSSLDSVYRVVEMVDRAMATSGDYRNFFVKEGVLYSHVIDPRSGKPVQTGVVSASVLAGTCVFADGLATGLMVLPPAEGIALVNKLPNVDCMLVVRGPDGSLSNRVSSGFPSR